MKKNRESLKTGIWAAITVAALSAAAAVPVHAMQVATEVSEAPAGQAQVKDDLFAGTEKFAQGASDVTDVDLGPDMLGMLSGKASSNLAHKMRYVVVRTYTYPRPGMYKTADVDAYRQKLRDGSWNCFIHTHESRTGESTDICNRPAPNHEGNELVILTVEPKELTFIHMAGSVSLADLGSLGSLGSLGNLGNLGGASAPPPTLTPRPPK